MDVDGAGIAEEVVTPDVAQELLSRKGAPLVTQEEVEEVQLLGLQIDALTVSLYFVPLEVELEVAAHLDFAVGLRLGAPKEGSNPRQELAHAEWLGNVIIRPQLQSHDLIDLIVTRCQHQ